MFGPATFGRLAKLVALMRSIRAATVLLREGRPYGNRDSAFIISWEGKAVKTHSERDFSGFPKFF